MISARGGAGERVVLEACSACDRRWWTRNGEPVQLEQLLEELASAPVPLRRAAERRQARVRAEARETLRRAS